MERLRDDPSRVVILGAGVGGSSLLELLLQERLVEVVAIVDRNAEAPGLARATEMGIPVYTDVEEALHASAPCIAFNLTADTAAEAKATAILGSGGVIGGLEARLIWRMVTDLREAKGRLEFQATHDELTGLYNRRHMLSEMERELNLSMRYGVPLSLVLIDLDQFKRINDTYGHAVGDEVLKYVAGLLRQHARASDVIGRWGGEEFLALLPHNSADNATQAVDKWLELMRRTPFMLPEGERLSVSFSAGVASFRSEDAACSVQEAIDRLLARADERLYAAKDAGRACVIGRV